MKVFIHFLALVASTISISNIEVFRRGNERFTARMFQEVVKNNRGNNFVMSAFSVLPALATLGFASVGRCHKEILNTIGMPINDILMEQFGNLNKHLRLLPIIELHLASKIYIRTRDSLNHRFAIVSRDVFNTEVQNIDFSQSTQAAYIINGWVDQKTNGRIKNFVSPSALSNTVALLVNTLYFKGKWQKPFDRMMTSNLTFHVSKERTMVIPALRKEDYHETYMYGESIILNSKLLELYFEGSGSSFLVVLPNKIDGIHSLVSMLRDPSVISREVKVMRPTGVHIKIPKFKISTTTDLKNVLSNMNVTKLFTPGQAQLHKLVTDMSDLFISAAVQKAYIDVNEHGVEAAAANEFQHDVSASLYTPNLKQFIADRPFYYALKIGDMITFSGIFAK